MKNKLCSFVFLLFGLLTYGEFYDLLAILNYELKNNSAVMQDVDLFGDRNLAIKKITENTLNRTPTKTELGLNTKGDYATTRATILNKFLDKKK